MLIFPGNSIKSIQSNLILNLKIPRKNSSEGTLINTLTLPLTKLDSLYIEFVEQNPGGSERLYFVVLAT